MSDPLTREQIEYALGHRARWHGDTDAARPDNGEVCGDCGSTLRILARAVREIVGAEKATLWCPLHNCPDIGHAWCEVPRVELIARPWRSK